MRTVQMKGQHRRRQVIVVLALLLISIPPASRSATVNPDAAHGKKVVYVYNQTKLEKARTAEPNDPKRIAQLESWRKNGIRPK
jgi:hypothetical protein